MPRDTTFLLRDADEMWSDTIVGSPLDMPQTDTLIMVTPAFVRKIENDIKQLKATIDSLRFQHYITYEANGAVYLIPYKKIKPENDPIIRLLEEIIK